MYVDLQQFCFHSLPVFSTRLALFQGNTVENSGRWNLKAGSSPPRAEMPTFKWLFLKNLGSKSLEQIQNLDPDHLMSGLKSKITPGDTLPARHTPIDA
jgi:hypothetical protein